MRILHINCNYILSTLHQLMIEELDSLGFENRVYVPTYDKNLSVIAPNDNVTVSECFKKWDRLVFDYKQSKIIKDIEKKFDVASFDCIHAYTLFTDGNCAKRLSEKYNVPYVVAVRNTDVNDFFRLMPHLRNRGVSVMRKAGAVFFLSEAYKKQVFDKYIPCKFRNDIAEKTQIIPNGIDDFWLENSPDIKTGDFSDKKTRLVYAGKIDKNKNISTTLKAVRILRENGRDVSLTVVGKISDKKEFKKISADRFTEYIAAQPKEKLMEIYRSHDIFVMPSFTESFGLVYAEAMSQGLPVVYSEGQGFDRQFPEGTVGFGVDSHSAEAVANAIVNISANYGTVTEAALRGARKFNWKEIVLRYSEVYENVEKNRNRQSADKRNF